MYNKRFVFLVILFCLVNRATSSSRFSEDGLSIRGNLIFLDGKPFDMWGIRVASATEDDGAMHHLIAQLDDYKRFGVNSVAVYFMGSRGGAYDPFSKDGKHIDKSHLSRMGRIIDEADKRGMVVIVGIFYQGVPPEKVTLMDWNASLNAVKTVALWAKNRGDKNIILNIANEQNSSKYEGLPWDKVQEVEDIISLCKIVKRINHRLIIGAGGYNINNNILLGASEYIDVLLFDTSTPAENSEFHYNIYKNAGVKVPMVNVEMFGGWTKRFKNGIFFSDPDVKYYFEEVDAVARIEGLYTFFFASDWSQSRAEGGANRYDLSGMGTTENPGIRWFFEYLSKKLKLQ